MRRLGIALGATVWVIGCGALFAMQSGQANPVDAPLADIKRARTLDDAALFGSAVAQLKKIDPAVAAVEQLRPIRIGSVLPVLDSKGRRKALKLALADPATRQKAQLIVGEGLLRGMPRERMRGQALLRTLSLQGNADAAISVMDYAESSGEGAVDRLELLNALPLNTSMIVERKARLIEANPEVSISPFESRDLMTNAMRLQQQEAANGDLHAMLAIANHLSASNSLEERRRAIGLYEVVMAAGSVEATVNLATLLREPQYKTFDPQRSIRLLEAAVRRGSTGAAYQVAETYRRGLGVRSDLPRAIHFYQTAAARGSAGAMYRLGLLEQLGMMGPPNPAAAAMWFARASQANSVAGRFRYGLAFLKGAGVPQDTRRGIGLIESAASQGSVKAMVYLAGAYASRSVVDRDLRRAQRWALRAVAAGSVDQDTVITAAQALASGAFADPQFARAETLLRGAMGRGGIKAQLQLGRLLLSLGGTRNEREGLALFNQAAANGDPGAIAALGALYASGNGVPVDASRSFMYYSVAARQGSAAGYRGLAVAYAAGFGVRKDILRSVHYYEMAAAQGDLRAMMLLAACHLDGCTGVRRVNDAVRYITTAAEQGENDANYQLGMLMLRGEIPGGRADAVKHLLQAARAGYPPAQSEIKKLGLPDPRTEQTLDALSEMEL